MIFSHPLLLAVVWACLTAECPESEDIRLWIQQAKRHQQEGQYSAAEVLLQRVLKASSEESRDMIDALTQLAGVLFLKADYTEAEAAALRALELGSQRRERRDLNRAENLNTLAEIFRARDQTSEADAMQKQALAIFHTRLGMDHPNTLTVLENRASLLAQQERFREAVQLSRRVLAGREKQLAPDNPGLATTLSNLAGYEMALGNSVNVEPLYRRALAIREQANGPEHPEMAVLLNNLAEHLRREGRFREAEPLYRRALAIQERLGPHPDYAATLNNWAEFQAGRRKKEAETSYRKAWSVAVAALGGNHLLAVTIQENLARHLQSLDRNEEALLLLQHALEIRTQKQGARHTDVLRTVSALDRLQRRRASPAESVPSDALRQTAHQK